MAQSEITLLIEQFMARGGSDLYIVAGSPPTMRQGDMLAALDEAPLTAETVNAAIRSLLPEADVEAFNRELEFNTAIDWGKEARLRVNLFVQQQRPGMVLRRINSRIPTLEELKLPPVYAQLAMEKRGLVLIAGQTHSGKSSTFAAMIGHRNTHGQGHIITLEDPVEFIHTPQHCLITQRDVGIDTHSMENALNNAGRQSPDVIAIGDLHDAYAVEHAMAYAEVGHLVLAVIDAGGVTQAIDYVLRFFPEDAQSTMHSRLSHSLRAILVQHLIPAARHRLLPAVEVLINEGLVRTLIHDGKLRDLRESMEKSTDLGMQTLDQALIALYKAGEIPEETAISESDNPTNMRLHFKQLAMERKTTIRPSTF